jgi:hypothetical protein
VAGASETYENIDARHRRCRGIGLILTACNTGTGRAPRAAALLQTHGYKVAGFCGLRDYKGSRVHPPVSRK